LSSMSRIRFAFSAIFHPPETPPYAPDVAARFRVRKADALGPVIVLLADLAGKVHVTGKPEEL